MRCGPHLLSAIIIVCQSGLPAFASGAISDVDNLSTRILQKELDLLRLNTRFRLETSDRSRLKPWRVFAYNLAAAGVSNAGITTIAAERWRTWQRPATASRNTLKAGPTLLLIGHSISLGGIFIESTIDIIKDYKTRKRGFDPETTRKRAIELTKNIDDLIQQRESLMPAEQTKDQGHSEILEGKLLKDLRNIAAGDYAQSYIRARKRKVARNVSYINGATAASTGGYMGSLCGLLAVADRKPRLAGPAGIGFILSGTHIAVAPVVTRVASDIEAARARQQLPPQLVMANPRFATDFDTHRDQFKTALNNESDEKAQKRLIIYDALNLLTDEQTAMNVREKQRSNTDFKERLFYNAAIGGTKIGWGIQLANAGFGFHPRPPQPTVKIPVQVGAETIPVTLPKPRGATELFAHRVAQGATTYIPGTGLWILDTLQSRARGERELYSMGSQDALPHQKLGRRLSKLDELEKLLPDCPL